MKHLLNMYCLPCNRHVQSICNCVKLHVELGNITILSYIVILKCHDNSDFFGIVISPMQYYR